VEKRAKDEWCGSRMMKSAIKNEPGNSLKP